MIVDEQKIVSFIKLLDGVPKQEWEVIKRSCDQLYELASFKITPKINDDSVKYFSNQIIDYLKIYDEIENESKKAHQCSILL